MSRMKTKYLGVLALVAIMGCESKNDSLLNGNSEESARINMNVRLNATHAMRNFLDQLEGATAPIDGALEEVAKVVTGDVKIPVDSKEFVKNNVVPKLRELLKKARKDLVHVEENGNFSSRTRIEWPIDRATTETRKSCKTSTLLVVGNWSMKDASQATVVLDDCTSGEPLVLVSASLDRDKNFKAQVNYGNLRRLTGDKLEGNIGGCEIESDAARQTVSCDPFTIVLDHHRAYVEKFVMKRSLNDVSGDMTMTVYPYDERPVMVIATYENGKPKIVLKKVQE